MTIELIVTLLPRLGTMLMIFGMIGVAEKTFGLLAIAVARSASVWLLFVLNGTAGSVVPFSVTTIELPVTKLPVKVMTGKE